MHTALSRNICDRPEIPTACASIYVHFPWTVSRVLAMCQALMCGVSVMAVWWFKLAIEDDITVYHYLTNWVFIAIGLFFLSAFAGHVEAMINTGMYQKSSNAGPRGFNDAIDTYSATCTRPDYITCFMTSVVTVPILGTTTGVTFSVLAVLQNAPGLVLDYVSDYGGGTVLNANFVFHVLTTLSVCLYVVLTWDQHAHATFVTLRGLVRLIVVQWLEAVLLLIVYLFGHVISDVYSLSDALPGVVIAIIFMMSVGCVVMVVNITTSPWNRLLLSRAGVAKEHVVA